MGEHDRRFWPFKPYTSIIATIVILIVLVPIFVFLQVNKKWPSQNLENTVLIIILVFSLLPVLLAFIDVIIERGGVIGYGNFKIDFSRIPKWGASEFTVPVNIGLPNQPVDSSSIHCILNALNNSTTCDVLVIDLKEGQSWWETRLLVLLTGAVWLKKPEKVVFVGKESEIDKAFLGWSHPHELLNCLLKDRPEYLRSYHTAQTAARQLQLVEPLNAPGPVQPHIPDWMVGEPSARCWGMTFDNNTGLPNELFAVRLLATDLGENVERQGQIKLVNRDVLDKLFSDVLRIESVDANWQPELQLSRFLNSDSDYLAVTQDRRYLKLVSRLTVLNTIVRTLVEKK